MNFALWSRITDERLTNSSDDQIPPLWSARILLTLFFMIEPKYLNKARINSNLINLALKSCQRLVESPDDCVVAILTC